MKKKNVLFNHILVFILAQLAWMGLLGLWIYWYVSNYIILEQVGNKLSPQIIIDSPNVLIFVGGIILIVAVAFGTFIIYKNLSVQLRLAKLYDNFISNVTHELKSPLASIQLYLETLSTRDVAASSQKEFLGFMLKDTERLNSLINSILEIPRIEHKKVAHDFHIYTAETITRTLLSETMNQFKIPEDSLIVDGSAPCKCVVDSNALKIVFDNLVDNATKYSSEPVRINVNLKYDKKKFLIDFSDRGIGISAKDLKVVFKKFHRIYHKDIPSVKGTGLGLYLVKEIIKSHGGKILVFSEGLNKGTTFRIELPIYQASKKYYINYLLKLTRKREREQELAYGEQSPEDYIFRKGINE
ncbi:MAG: HAMP domain-containing histidine kinase [Bacteroidetes bacterium]|nr:HAMP domain-containing histidine kinase [Bacteroidota bacterium]